MQNNNLSGCFPASYNTFCGISYDFSNNPLLPWEGDFSQFCSGGTQIGAPCDNSATSGSDEIQPDCSCDESCPVYDGTLSATTPICNSESTDITFNFSGGTPPYDVIWTGGAPLNNIDDGHTITLSPTTTTTYSISSITDANGCSGTPGAPVTVTVLNLLNVGNVTGAATVCQGAMQSYAVPAVAGATEYDWSVPAGAVITSTAPFSNTINVNWPAGASSGDVCCAAVNQCGAGAPQCRAVNFVPIPDAPGPIDGPTEVCRSTSQSFSIDPVPDAVSYTWTVPTGATITSGQGSESIVVNFGPSAQSGNICVRSVAAGSCGQSSQTCLPVTAVAQPVQPVFTAGANTMPCEGSTTSYSVTPQPSVDDYQWDTQGYGEIVSGQGTPSVTILWTLSGATTLSVTAGSSICGNAVTKNLSITVRPLPEAVSNVTGDEVTCTGAITTYTADPVPGATSYTWEIPAMATAIGNTTGISLTLQWNTAGITTFSVRANNTCGTGEPYLTTVVVNNTPVQPGPVTGPATVCAGSQAVFSIAAVADASTYNWTVPAGATIIGGQGTTTITVNFTAGASGQVCVAAVNNCGNSPVRCTNVTVGTGSALTAGAISGPAAFCPVQNTVYSISAVAGASGYQWTVPAGAAIASGQNTTTITVQWNGITGGQVCVSAVGSCGAGTPSCISVAPPAGTVFNLGADTTLCPGSPLTLSAGTGATGYLWNTSATTNQINVSLSGTYTVTVTAGAGNTCAVTDQIGVTFAATVPPPAVTALQQPATTTNVPVSTPITWQPAGGCTGGYFISVGTTPGGTDIINNFNNGSSNTWQPGSDLPPGTIIYVTITPFNNAGNGPAGQFSFTTVTAFSSCTTVTTTADSGLGSFREAINCANNNPGPDTIRFNIPGPGPHIIQPLSNLPRIVTDSVIIDAATQPGWAPGAIVLDGSMLSPWAVGIDVAVPNNIESGFQLYGLTIRNFKNNGLNIFRAKNIRIGAPGKGNVIYANATDTNCNECHNVVLQECSDGSFKSNIIGLREDYSVPTGTNENVSAVGGELRNFTIGGSVPAGEGNVFGHSYGMFFWDNTGNSFGPDSITVLGNYIGITPNGVKAGNTRGGIRVADVPYVQIGNGDPAFANHFGHISPDQAVWMEFPSSRTELAANAFECNLIPVAGSTTAAPVVSTAEVQLIKGTAIPSAKVEVFKSTDCAGTPCQGKDYLGTTTADASGNWTLLSPFNQNISGGDLITAMATLNHSTSAFANCTAVQMTSACPGDSLRLVQFFNSLDGPNWLNKNNWLLAGKPIDQWYGVYVNNQGCVDRIYLPSNKLTGELPVLNFPQLVELRLQINEITGDLNGKINTPLIKVIWLQSNDFYGSIPDYDFPDLFNLNLGNNQFSGTVPKFNLPKLEVFACGTNRLDSIPALTHISTWGQSGNPNVFYVQANKFTFDDILPNISIIDAFPSASGYAPQDSFYTDTVITRIAGQSLTIDLGIDSAIPDNYYNWVKSGNSGWVPPSGNNPNSNKMTWNNLKVTDSGNYYVEVTNPAAPLLTLHSKRITLDVQPCISNNSPLISGPLSLCDGSATLSTGGSFTAYNWSSGQSTSSIQVSQPGTYTVTATESNGCFATGTYTLAGNNPAPAPVISGATVLCSGAATLSTGAYAAYIWSNNATGQAISVNQTGNYAVTVTDANGCQGNALWNITANVPSPTPAITGPTALCPDMAVLQTGSFAGYSWSNSATTNAITVIQNGIYTVTVTDANGCTGTSTHAVNGNTIPPQPDITGPTALCPDMAVLQTGIFAGYSWSNSATTASVTVAQNGIYTVTVTDANGCTGSTTHSVNGSATPPQPEITGPSALCSGIANLQLNTTFFSYAWSDNTANSSITITQSGFYTVTVADANGCTGTDARFIGAGTSAPTPNITVADQACTVSATLNAGTYQSYIWATGETDAALIVTASGLYNVTVTDMNGCTGAAGFNYTPAPPLNVAAVASDPVSCIAPDGSIDIEMTSGTPPFNYFWSSGATTQDLISQGSGTYTVTVTDATNCTFVSTSTLSAPGSPVVTPSVTEATCQQNNGSITLDVSGINGTPVFLWSNGATTSGITNLSPGFYTVTVTAPNMCTNVVSSEIKADGSAAPQPAIAGVQIICGDITVLSTDVFNTYLWSDNSTGNTLTVNAIGFYTVTVTDANGCTGTATHEITAKQTPPSPEIMGGSLLCSSPLILTLSQNYAAAQWSNGQTSQSLLVNAPGIYSVTVTDTAGCTGTASATVTDGTSQILSVSPGGSVSICAGESISLSSAAMPGFTYQWFLDNAAIPGAASPVYQASLQGQYTLLASANGCTLNSEPVQVTVKALPVIVISAGGNTQFCEGSMVALNAPQNSSFQYQWEKNGQIIDGAVSSGYTADTSGLYRVAVTAAGCRGISNEIVIDVLPKPVITIDAIEPAFCGEENGAVELTITNASGNVTYDWDNGAETKDLKNAAPGSYQITVTGGNACTSAAAVTIPDIPVPQPQIVGPDEVVPGERIILNTGQLYAAYLWSTGAETPTIETGIAGSYTVTITDENGCTASAEKVIRSDLDHFLDGADDIIPKAFTPVSSPGQNDDFDPVKALENAGRPVHLASEISMIVFVRNQEAVLRFDPYPDGGWHHSMVDDAVPEGTYYYILEFVFPDGQKVRYKAVVNLIR